ncbi:hypothetical protein [Mycobacteroides abscessus]|uniref:hypothetical protein n=1 Tax=Mycobacteroides abscessus TaxID=36809 RepID=UPI0009A6ED7F|nr:hypothetical protein [Mycobacteroides abscessus]SKG76090.1 Uncharacterised protein [Mycobacteroides abscessus subsp. massiliense]
MSNEDWEHLAEVLENRISELNLTQSEIQARGGPSPAKVREIINRRATSLSPSKRRDLERAVEWETGGVDTALKGGMPTTKSSSLESALGKLIEIYAKHDRELAGDKHAPLIELVVEGQALAAAKDDPDVSAYVRRVEAAVVGVVGIERVTHALDTRTWSQTIRRATELGVLDEFMNEEDRIDQAGLTGRDRVRHLSIALEDILARRATFTRDAPEPAAAIVAQSLNEHYAEMRRRAQQQRRHRALIDQAKQSLGHTDSPLTAFPSEVDDAAYVQYLAARLSTPHQGGDPDLHAQLSLSPAEYEAAQTRYRREFSEMVVFDGVIRTVEIESSKRPSQPDSQDDKDGYDPNLAKSWMLGEAEAPSMPDFVRAAVPARMIAAYEAAIDDIPKRTAAIPNATRRGEPVTVDMVGAVLRAIDNFDAAARDIVTRMQDLELHATQQQIDVALPLFEVGWEFSDELIDFIDTLLPAAPNKEEITKLRKAQASLRALSEFHHDAHDAWVESGRSSRPGMSRAHSLTTAVEDDILGRKAPE